MGSVHPKKKYKIKWNTPGACSKDKCHDLSGTEKILMRSEAIPRFQSNHIIVREFSFNFSLSCIFGLYADSARAVSYPVSEVAQIHEDWTSARFCVVTF